MNLVAVVLSCVVAAACAGTSPSSEAGGGGREETPTRGNVMTAAPSTFEVALSEEALQRLERGLRADSLEVARLALRDLRPRSARALKGVLVFVERPDADAGTPVGDPHYAGNFVLGFQSPETMLFNLAPTLSRLWRLGALDVGELRARGTLRVTFVPEPWEHERGLGEDFALPFSKLELEVPP